MKKLIVIPAVFFVTVFGCKAQTLQQRNISEFNKMEISGGVNVIYTTSDSLNLQVSAFENELSQVETKVENGTLYVSNKGTFKGSVNVYVKNKSLNELLCSGATKFRNSNLIKEDAFTINASGASNVKLRLETNSLKVVESGASNITLNGSATELKAELAGASVLSAYALTGGTVNVNVTGAAKAKVFAVDKANANASGAGVVKIKGDTKDVTAESTPGASITKIKTEPDGEKGDGDTTIYNWKGRKVLVIRDKENFHIKKDNDHESSFKHWHGFSFGVNGYMNSTGGINVPKTYRYMDLNYSRSFNFQINPIERQFNIHKNYVKLVTGLGFDMHRYQFAHKTNLNADSSFTWGKIDSTNQFTYSRNKLNATYLQIPLLLEFNTSNNPDKTFHIAFGVIGQYLLAAKTIQNLEQNKYEIEKIRKDNYNISPFGAKAHVNMGYRGWTLFAEYNLTPLFDLGKGPQLYPFTAGLRVIPFS